MTDLIKEYEGYVDTFYICPAGKYTFGWGHALLSTDRICGITLDTVQAFIKSITPDNKLSRVLKNKALAKKFSFHPDLALKEAERLHEEDVKIAQKGIKRLVKVSLNKNQLEALTSWVFNFGSGNLKTSTLLKKLNTGDYVGASQEFFRWNKMTVGGKKVIAKGLVRRREAEARLFNEPIKKVT